jgi:predicted RNA-binding protein with PUA-like domain
VAYWLLKTEPECYSFEDLERDGKTVWEGVSNNWALQYLRQMKKGDLALIYHTGNVKSVVGVAEVIKSAYVDPKGDDPKLAVVDLKAKKRLARPISLAEIKSAKGFEDFLLVKMGRLSVMPVTEKQWEKLAGGKR